MSAEHKGKYIKHFTSEHIPPLTWQEMLETGETIRPQILALILAEARNDLLTIPGPNLERRQKHVPEWFDYWINLCDESSNKMMSNHNRKLYPFDEVSGLLNQRGNTPSGILMLAGGEGHKGHLKAAQIMKRKIKTVIFAFEEPEYLEKHKERGEFLPLTVRLSMWNLNPNVSLLTTLPLNRYEAVVDDHYKSLFERSGASMQFVEDEDPHLSLKKSRIIEGFPMGYNVYQHELGIRTSTGVKKLLEPINLYELFDRLPLSIHESITAY